MKIFFLDSVPQCLSSIQNCTPRLLDLLWKYKHQIFFLELEQQKIKQFVSEMPWNILKKTLGFLKAFVGYFLLFHQMIGLQMFRKMLFISSKKLFLFSKYSDFCNFFPLSHLFQIQKDKWECHNLCYEFACKN